MIRASAKAKILCLRQWVSSDLAGRTAYTWSALSQACHQHAYDLAPTASELSAWIETVDELERTVRARIASRPEG